MIIIESTEEDLKAWLYSLTLGLYEFSLTFEIFMQSIAGSLQSLCWASAAIGGVASAYFSGSLIETYGTRGVFGLTAIFPLIVSLSAILISERPVSNDQHSITSSFSRTFPTFLISSFFVTSPLLCRRKIHVHNIIYKLPYH